MLRRTILLALAGFAIAAPPAFADSHWNSQMQDATDTVSRSAGGCSITHGPQKGWLVVACGRGERAQLTYSFPIGRDGIQGTPWCTVAGLSLRNVDESWRIVNGTLRVTVTVGSGTAYLSTVSVGYYTKR